MVVVNICFANPMLLMSEHISDVMEAVRFAALNLGARYHIYLEEMELNEKSNSLCVIFDTFSEKKSKFIDSPGKRLKGISMYLLRHYPEKYKDKRIGTRLLYYSAR